MDLAPIPLFPVTPSLPLGDFAYNCRLLEPATGRAIALDINKFKIVEAP